MAYAEQDGRPKLGPTLIVILLLLFAALGAVVWLFLAMLQTMMG